jgi:hypothetical protein
MKRSIIVIFCLFLLDLSCATTQKTPKEQPERKESPVNMIEDFDPSSLNDEIISIKPKSKKDEQTFVPSSLVKTDTANTSGDSIQVETRQVPGYRVQIAAVTNQQDAIEIRRKAMLDFENANVYLIFEPPYYKIRVGDFEYRHTAEELQQKAIQLDYKDSWIVPTIVSVNNGQ